MSTTDNIHKKVISTNALKTNFISNTNTKNKDNQKRFSNISKEKQFTHQVQTNYPIKIPPDYQDVDMQGSATILPQKNSSRKNIYVNQNNNSILPTHQRKQSSQQLNLNNIKTKSPIDKTRINTINNIGSGSNASIMTNNAPLVSNIQMIPSNITQTSIDQTIQNQIKPIPQIKNIQNKISQVMTDRQKSQKNYRQREQSQKDQQINKMKSMIMNQRKFSSQMEDLMCDQQIQMTLVPQKQHSRKLSNHYSTKNQAKSNIQGFKQKEKQQHMTLMSDHYSDQNTKTQKKYLAQKPIIILEKTRSQHTITTKQLSTINSATLNNNIIGQKSIPHLILNNQIQQGQNRLQPKFHVSTGRNMNYEEELKEQLRKFSLLQSDINMSAQSQTIIGLENRQKKYLVQPNYIELKQKNFNWFMRAILMDWMMHVCYEFGLKRQTYYIAVSLVDKFLEKTIDLSKSDFQLTGAASMFIAAKLEEFQALSSADFSKSTDNRYSPIQIRQMQLKICKTMNYELNPPTLYMWANRFMVHWDNYIDLTDAKYHPYFSTHKPKYFKKQAQQSYLLFRQMLQFIDCSILDVQTLQFAHKILVCSFMYLVLGKSYKQWPVKRIIEEFPRTSHYLVEQEQVCSFNHLFHMFLADSFELDIIELLPAVQYCSTYFTLSLTFDPPSYALKNNQQEQSQLCLQEYESFQTYNGKTIDLIKKRYRGVYS